MLVREMFYKISKQIIIIIIVLCNFINPSYSSIKKNIINNLLKTNNLNFDFEQKIEQKIEKGKCTIKYPKKIYCIYDNLYKKIMISNGKTLLIKNLKNNYQYIYPLKKTPLEMILDKDYLIKQITNLKINNITDDKISFVINKKDLKIKIFFEKNTNNLKGWETEDIYQNKVIFNILNINTNQKIDNKIFRLPKLN